MNTERLKTYLLERDAISYPTLEAGQRLAAVLILLTPGKNAPELIFTRRSKALSNHAGQISFPGGTVENSDLDPVHTALRESEEEIGLNRAYVDILGTLDWHTLPSGFIVLPVVGHMTHKQEFTAAPEEVTEIFSIPLQILLDVSLYKNNTITRNGVKRLYYFFEFKEYYIWGATAAVLRSLAMKLSDS